MGTDTARRVLVVDDEADIRELVQMKLEQSGYEVVSAEDGPAALSAVQGFRPDVVVLDVGMPGMTGYDVCKKFKADPDLADVPVIMLTARTQGTYSTLGYMAGADLYLTKPFSPRELVERIEETLAAPPARFGDAPEPAEVAVPATGDQWEYPSDRGPQRWWRRGSK